MRFLFSLLLAAWAGLSSAATLVRGDEAFPAHRVVGNVYYVGSKELASYLITTPKGHILINSSFEETVPLIRGAIESLGFQMRDVKILLASHAHNDHVAGHAKMRELTGAKVYVMNGDDGTIASGGGGQYLYHDHRWAPCPVDRVLQDGELIGLDNVALLARKTPGHTRGCTTWTWTVEEGGKTLHVVVIGSPNVNPGYQLVNNRDYPEIATDFARTFAVLKHEPCDVFLGAHGNYYDMLTKYERLQKEPGTNPFIDPQGYKAYVALKEAAFRKTLADQQAAAGSQKDDSKTSAAAASDDAAIAAQLRKAGAEVTEKNGVVTDVRVGDTTKMKADDFRAIGRLGSLKTLSTSGDGVNDTVLGYWAGLTSLEDLSTNLAQFTDEGLKQFTALKNLKQIKFFHTSLKRKDFTGAGYAHLATMPNLRRLTVAGCPFNDEGMAAVAKLTQLENFRTWHTYQSEAGNRHLPALVNLKSLHLGQRLRRYDGSSNAHSVTDATMDVLAACKTLETLTLDEARLSATALEKLKALPNLKVLELNHIEFTAGDVEQLRRALPDVKIAWQAMTAEERERLERLLKP